MVLTFNMITQVKRQSTSGVPTHVVGASGLMIPRELSGDSILSELFFDKDWPVPPKSKLSNGVDRVDQEVQDANFINLSHFDLAWGQPYPPPEKEHVTRSIQLDQDKQKLVDNLASYWADELNRLESLVAVLMEENEELATDISVLSREKKSLSDENQALRHKLKESAGEVQMLREEIRAHQHQRSYKVHEDDDDEDTCISLSSSSNVETSRKSNLDSDTALCQNQDCLLEKSELQTQNMRYLEEIRVLTDVSHSSKLYKAELTKKAKDLELVWMDFYCTCQGSYNLEQPIHNLLKYCRSSNAIVGANVNGHNLLTTPPCKNKRRSSIDHSAPYHLRRGSYTIDENEQKDLYALADACSQFTAPVSPPRLVSSSPGSDKETAFAEDDAASVMSTQSANQRGNIFGRMFRGKRGNGNNTRPSSQSVC